MTAKGHIPRKPELTKVAERRVAQTKEAANEGGCSGAAPFRATPEKIYPAAAFLLFMGLGVLAGERRRRPETMVTRQSDEAVLSKVDGWRGTRKVLLYCYP